MYLDTALNHLVLDMEIFLIFWSGYFDENEVALMHTMKTRGIWRYSSVILNLGTRWGWVVTFISHHLPLGKVSWFPLVGGWVVQRANLDILNMRRISYHCWKLNHDSWNIQKIVEVIFEVCYLNFQFLWRDQNNRSTIQCSIPT